VTSSHLSLGFGLSNAAECSASSEVVGDGGRIFFWRSGLTANFRARPLARCGRWRQGEEFGHEDYYPRLRDRSRRRRDDRFGTIYILITERVTELRLRDYIPTIQTIAVGFVLIGLAQALRLSLLIWNWVVAIYQSIQIGPTQ
jgi:hypothetical protein